MNRKRGSLSLKPFLAQILGVAHLPKNLATTYSSTDRKIIKTEMLKTEEEEE